MDILDAAPEPLNPQPTEQAPVPRPIDDGGFAFPMQFHSGSGDTHLMDAGEQYGMSLRDYFAVHIVSGYIAASFWSEDAGDAAAAPKSIARAAYEIAARKPGGSRP